jgi:outer membrane protease
MKQTFAMIVLVLLVGVGEISAQQTYEFSVDPVVGMRFGDTRFEIKFDYLLPDSSTASGGSELVFPLDVTQTGIQFAFKVVRAGHKLWTADLRLLFAVSNPGSKMTDKDWDNFHGSRLEWSSTESRVDGTLSEIEFEATRLLVSGRGAELAALVGVSYQSVKQKMTDLSGWQLGPDQDDNMVVYLFDVDILAGTYEIRYIRPQFGLAPRLLFGSFSVEGNAMVSPLLHVKDKDDHVLRYFQVRTDGKGFGYGGRVALQYEPPATSKSRFFGRLSGEISRAEIEVAGYREYYADNPDEGMEAGNRFAEEHTVSSTQYGVHLVLGVSF